MSAASALSACTDPFLRVHSWNVAWGTPRADGSLGYDGGCCPGVLCRADLRSWQVLSAHAPSRVEIEVGEPVELFGILNASARFDPRNPVEFWANWNFVGDLTVPGSVTPTMKLAPGRHLLVAHCAEASARHTLWAIRRAEAAAPRAITVVTIAAYPEERVPTEIGILARSARKCDVPLKVCFVGEGYASHAEMKIRRMRPIVASMTTPRVLYVDGRDCFFLTGLDRLARQFEGMQAPIVMSAEASCWPIVDPAWAGRFPRRPSGCNWLCAGQWMGERDASVRALDALADLSERARRPHVSDEMPDLSWARHLPDDDQLLWQVAALNGLVDVAFDSEGCVFRNVNTLDTNLISNRDFDLSDGVMCVGSRQRPCVLHFSGWGAQYCMHQWGGMLGAY